MIYYPKATSHIEEDTKSVQDAIDIAARSGGGTIWLSAGKSYYCKTLVLRSHITLHLENGARLLASGNLQDYQKGGEIDTEQTKGVGTPVLRKPAFAFLYAYDADSVVISGEGTIDGNCYQFVKRINPYHQNGDFYPRPTLIYMEKCNNVSVKGIKLTNSPFWSLHTAGCDNVLIEGITIKNPLDVANSDGIDPDHCTNVRILGCHITCADDCICLKNTKGNEGYPPTRAVVIGNCTLVSTSAALKIGTEGVDDFSDILVHDCIVSSSNRGISIQVRDAGSVSNVHFSNILIQTRLFSSDYWGKAEAIAVTSFNRDDGTVSGNIQNIRFSNIRCEGEGGVLVASDGDKVRDISFDHVRVKLKKTSKWPLEGYDLRPRQHEPFLKRNVSAFFLSSVKAIHFSSVEAQVEDYRGFGSCLETENATYTGEVCDAP